MLSESLAVTAHNTISWHWEGFAFPGSCFDSKCHGDGDLVWQRWCQVFYCNALQKHGIFNILPSHTIFPKTMWKTKMIASKKPNKTKQTTTKGSKRWHFSMRDYARDTCHFSRRYSSEGSGSLPTSYKDWQLRRRLSVISWQSNVPFTKIRKDSDQLETHFLTQQLGL